MNKFKALSSQESKQLFTILKSRFEQNMNRHPNLNWSAIEEKLIHNPEKLWSLSQMEDTGGEPDVVLFDTGNTEIVFYDCAIETPKGRRSFCYDREALNGRKENKPADNVIDIAQVMGVQLLTEQQYRYLQTIFNFDLKTSSWIKTPETIRQQGGALFCDYRYGQVFTYHNGAQSYYASRGFRALLEV